MIMKEQDIRAVESMCRCGLSLEGILESFPKFPKEEVTAIYERFKGADRGDSEDVGLSINCS